MKAHFEAYDLKMCLLGFLAGLDGPWDLDIWINPYDVERG